MIIPPNLKNLSTPVLLTVLGFSFWFFLGFPFASHSESYILIPQIESWGVFDVLTRRMQPVATYRPLGQLLIYLGYKLSNGSLFVVQLFNYLVAMGTWVFLCLSLNEKKIFSLFALTAGGFLFSGYIYLFNLNGMFYTPLVAFVAVMLYIHKDSSGFIWRRFLVLLIIAVICAFSHPFSLLLFFGYYLGLFIEERKNLSKKQMIRLVSGLAVTLILAGLLAGGKGLVINRAGIAGLIFSYRMVEINAVISIYVFLAIGFTVMGLHIQPPRKKIGLLLAVLLTASVAYLIKFPLLLAWVLLCLVKMTVLRKWTMVFLILATFLFPYITATGSPTYTIFVIMLLVYASASGYSYREVKLTLINFKVALTGFIICLAIVLLIKSGVYLPVLTRTARPLLAEQERTVQLEKIIDWFLKSDLRDHRLLFHNDALYPVDSPDIVDRKHRPPTREEYFIKYLDYRRLKVGIAKNPAGRLQIIFGAGTIDGAVKIYSVPGKYAGEAAVCRWKNDGP